MAYNPPNYSLKAPTLGQAIRGGIKEAIGLRAAEQQMQTNEQAQGLAQARLGLDTERLGLDERRLESDIEKLALQERQLGAQQRAVQEARAEAQRTQSELKYLIGVPQKDRDQKWVERFLIASGHPEKIIEKQWESVPNAKKDADLVQMGIVSQLGKKDDKEGIRTILQTELEAAKNSNNKSMIQDAYRNLKSFDLNPDAYISSHQAVYETLINKGADGVGSFSEVAKGAAKSYSATNLDPIIAAGEKSMLVAKGLENLDLSSEKLAEDSRASNIIKSLGGSLSDAGSTFTSRVEYLIPLLKPPASGPQTELDAVSLRATLPKISQSKEARDDIMGALASMADFSIKRSNLARQIKAELSDGLITATQAEERIQKFDAKGFLSESFKKKYNVGDVGKMGSKTENKNIKSLYDKYG